MATYILCLWALGSLPSQTLPSVPVLKGLHAGGRAVSLITLWSFREGGRSEREKERDMFPHIYKKLLASCKSLSLSSALVKRKYNLVAHFFSFINNILLS